MRGNIFWVLLGILVLLLTTSPVYAGNYTETISYLEDASIGVTYTGGGTGSGGELLNYLTFYDIENYKHVSMFELQEEGVNAVYATTYTSSPFTAKIGGAYIGSGMCIFSSSSDNVHDRLSFYFSDWNIGSLTGNKDLIFTFDHNVGFHPSGKIADGNPSILGPKLCFYTTSKSAPHGAVHVTSFYTQYAGILNINQTPFLANGTFTLSSVSWNRQVNGENSASSIDVRSDDGAAIFLNDVYGTSGITSSYIDRYPSTITISLGADAYITYRYLTGDNPEFDIEIVPTISPTPTPTPMPELCGYWSFAVNASNIVRNGYVTGTLTESDPDNKHKKIDWYVVLPSGQEITKKSFVYDDGFFGLGAGWIEIDVSTGSASASSEAAAKANSLQYVMAGNNQKMRVKIYEDKSLIPLAYHDYHLFCTLDQTVHVSETTQGLSVWNINAYDQLTNNLISGITVHLYDYQSGEWQNKTTLIGGSYQFNVVPGNKYRIYIDESYWNTYDEDYTIPSPVPSQPYPVYLIRPLEVIEDASWVMFYVRDGSTLNLMGGVSIALSDGQIQSTSKSGFAKFNVSDSTLYYWSASKTGYTGQSGTFNISSDTLLPDVYLYPAAVVTTPTTIPYWTQTPTPLPTYANGTVIPGYTYAPTVTSTLNVIERGAKLTESTDIWYRNAPFLSNLLFLCVILGIMGLMTKSNGGGRGGRRKN